MSDLRRVPPGRAGRIWLTGRLRAARLAADLLERKLVILRTERDRFATLAEQTAARWRHSRHEADVWGERAAVLGGQREFRLSAADQPAVVRVVWNDVMGLRYPVDATCALPEPARRAAGTAALVEAEVAYRDALAAAVPHAAALAATRGIEAEIVLTRRRLRAIADRRVPRLEAALRDVTHRLDEDERAETFRLRWATTGNRPG